MKFEITPTLGSGHAERQENKITERPQFTEDFHTIFLLHLKQGFFLDPPLFFLSRKYSSSCLGVFLSSSTLYNLTAQKKPAAKLGKQPPE